MLRLAFWLVFVAHAQTLEVIPLKYRTADQVLDTLRPLVEPGGTLTGRGNQLILRVSPANLAEIQRALDAIDRPQRRLQISVRLDDALESSRRDLAVGGSVSNQGVRIEGSARDSQRNLNERVDQRLQVLEGGRAMISTGQSRPLVVPGATVIDNRVTGFEVVPRLAGSEVILDIVQQRDSRQSQQSAATTVRAPLGQWVEIGSTARMAVQDNRSIGSASRVHRDESRQVWVKVEALPN